eukprot:COSAG03_NODE_1105_length_4804_cov_14.592561_3_plen_748_part_00
MNIIRVSRGAPRAARPAGASSVFTAAVRSVRDAKTTDADLVDSLLAKLAERVDRPNPSPPLPQTQLLLPRSTQLCPSMESSAVLALLSGGSIERCEWNSGLCDELCAALHDQARASSSSLEGIKDTKIDVEGRNSTGETPFLLVCWTGHVQCMQLLAEAGCDTATINNNGLNALMFAADSGVAAPVRAALAAGWCELEARDNDGSTAFLYSCTKGNVECTELIVEAGCNTAANNNNGINALMCAAMSGVQRYIARAIMSWVPAASVRAVLAAGWCELEATDNHGRTAFLLACGVGDVACMQVLAEAGCNTATINNYGVSALMVAAESGVAAAVRAALAAGWCELEARSIFGNTAFLRACDKGHVECMQVLAEAGCNTATINNNGVNALMFAADSGIAAAVRTVLAAGWCELEARSTSGCTAFLYACAKGNVECMELIVEAGCNTAANDTCGLNATGCTKSSESIKAMQWLRQHNTATMAAALVREGQELLASGKLSEAKTVAEKACCVISSLPGSHELDSACTELRDAIQIALTKDFEERECRARVAEAELMAMLDGESTSTSRTAEQEQKAQRKKEKRRKQQQAKREAAARRAEALADPESEQLPAQEPEPAPEQATEAEPVAQPEPEPDEQLVPLSPAVSAPESPCEESESDGALTSVRTAAPDEFCCPITSECMRDPVIVTATGMTYEREAIAEWLCGHDIDPSTGIKLGENKQLTPNVALRKAIDAWSHGCLLMYSSDTHSRD